MAASVSAKRIKLEHPPMRISDQLVEKDAEAVQKYQTSISEIAQKIDRLLQKMKPGENSCIVEDKFKISVKKIEPTNCTCPLQESGETCLTSDRLYSIENIHRKAKITFPQVLLHLAEEHNCLYGRARSLCNVLEMDKKEAGKIRKSPQMLFNSLTEYLSGLRIQD